MRFEQPHLLWLLLVLPLALALFFWWASRKRQRLLAQFIQTRLLSALTVGVSPTRRKIRLGCLILAVTLLVVALARPQHGFDLQKIEQRGLDIVVAVDTSKSMLAGDIAPNRLERARLAVLDLMQQAKPDRLGLVAFAGDAFLECPLTFDSTVFQQSVQTLNVNTLPQGGTAIAAAIKTAQTAFKESDHYKVLVLFTDGEDNDGGALAAAQEAAKAGLHIFTIGIGTPQGDLLHITDASGNSDYVRDEQGHVVKSHLNEALLRQIAGATGGFYLPLRGANTMETLYEKGLAPLPKSEGEERLVRRYHEQYHWPLAAAALLLLAEMFLPERKRAAKAARPVSSTSTSVARATTIVMLFCVLPMTAFASASSALRDYNKGQYDSALKQYQQLLRKKTDDPRLNFNTGAAAYRSRKFNDATTNFSTVISAPDLKLQEQGYYNLGDTLYRLGEQSPDLDKRKESWENALKNYSNSLQLNPQDADAKFNYEFVQKKLEELKKQQQQQPKQNQQQQKNNQQQAKDNQSSQQNQQQQNQQQNQSQQAQRDEQQKQQQQNEQQKPQQNQQAQNQSEQQKKQQQAQSPAGQSNEKQGGQNEQAQAMVSNEMTPEEARRLLDAQKGNEQFLQLKPQGKPQNNHQPIKDW
ncbi:MAG: VWA domain-containing protein [Verrucomicrobiota bacterium]|jgi:Ca-activated chloride channel family protein